MPDFGWGGGQSEGMTDDSDLGGRELFLRFAGFKRERDRPDALMIRRKTKYGFQEQDGQVYKGAAVEPLTPAEAVKAYERRLHWKFEIVKPYDLNGRIPAYTTTLKGVQIGMRAGKPFFKFIVIASTGFNRAAYIDVATACGFNDLAVDETSELFEPMYVTEEMLRKLSAPLTFEQIAKAVVEPILLACAAEGHLIYAKTGDNSPWLQTATIKAVPDRDAKAIYQGWEAYQPGAEAKARAAGKSPPLDPDNVYRLVDMRQCVREAVRSNQVDYATVIEAIKTLAPNIDVTGDAILDQLEVDHLSALITALALDQGQEKAGPTL